MIKRALEPIDNSPLIVFRIIFGFLFVCESFGAILTGWVKENFVNTNMTFSHIFVEWLQPLPGDGMYYYFIVMGLASLGVMLGYRYRLNIILLTLLWAGVYYMQKTSYNNHYYLMLIICFYMCFMPANRYASLDVKQRRIREELAMPKYISWIFIIQITIVYFFGTIAKFYPDWLNGTFVNLLYSGANIPQYFKDIFTQPWFYLTISYLGILFDGLVVPMLLWKRTRTIAVIASLIFHLFNSLTLHIGIFPYFALSFSLFFYNPNQVRAFFFKKKPILDPSKYTFNISKWQAAVLSVFILFQMILPLRHHLIEGDVLWTDEAHRLSWRMMLRSRGGYTNYTVVEKESGNTSEYPLDKILTPKQIARLSSPDMIWQMAQVIKREYAEKGIEIGVYAETWVSINNRDSSLFTDPTVDLASVEWDYFRHNRWVVAKPF